MKIDSQQQYFEDTFKQQTRTLEIIENSEFEDCAFIECDFSEVTFSRCKFLNCTFTRCNLSLVKIPYSQFFEVEFSDSKLVGVDWTRASWPTFNLSPALKFIRSILNDCSFFALTLNELVLDECKLHDVDFREGDFSHAVMVDNDFSHSLFSRSNLQHVDFSGSTNFTINILENNVANAKFSRYEALALLDSLKIQLVD